MRAAARLRAAEGRLQYLLNLPPRLTAPLIRRFAPPSPAGGRRAWPWGGEREKVATSPLDNRNVFGYCPPIPSPEGACSRPPGSRGEGAAPAPVGARRAFSPARETDPIVPGVSSDHPSGTTTGAPRGPKKRGLETFRRRVGAPVRRDFKLQRLVRRSLTPRPVPDNLRAAAFGWQDVIWMDQRQAAPPTPALPHEGGGSRPRRSFCSPPPRGEGLGGGGAAGENASPLISCGTLAYGRPATTRGTQRSMVSLTGKRAIVTGAAKGNQIEVRRDQ
jgi:hypothetical protein